MPLIQMNALMGHVRDVPLAALLELDLPAEAKARTIRAFNKLLWVQNDLVVRHYARN
ncbi:MAG: protoglobin family protein [Planctomycetota bacterium]|nr:protoglobin family protein [Planctomycetota bacterium]